MIARSKTPLVLLIQSDAALAKRIARELDTKLPVTVRVAKWGYEGLWATVEAVPDVILIDERVPDINVLALCRVLRSREETGHVPVIILGVTDETSAASVADDYVKRPISMEDVRTRVTLALRRDRAVARQRLTSYRSTHLLANFSDGFVAVDGQRINLTRREFELLWYFVEHKNQVLSSDQLHDAVWPGGVDETETRTVITHVARLRRKLGTAGKQIQTFFRKGYIFVDEGDRLLSESD